ncbi:acyl-CoA dehydrogenase family protein [Mycobacterium sp. NPDC049093]
MDFSFDEEQQEIQRLADDLLGRISGSTDIGAVETGADGFDRALWHELAASGLLGAALPAELGGEGLDLAALCLLLEQQGRRTLPAPIWPSVVAALAIAQFDPDGPGAGLVESVCRGEGVLTVALEEAQTPLTASPTAEGWALTGRKVAVPVVAVADAVVATAVTPEGTGLFLVSLPDSTLTAHPHRSTTHEPCATVDFDSTPAVMLGAPDGTAVTWTCNRARLAVSALALGVGTGAVEHAVPYLNERRQFGRPLSGFQAVAHQLADCYIDLEAMRTTLWHAVWRTTNDLPADTATSVAKWWASDAGQRIVHRIIHVHGGMGVDEDYPVHRYLLWGKQLASTLGSAGSELATIGAQL